MKCNKVKNPCKICFETVTNKKGLQCQGACRKWAHFKCLNYTPGKIQDIKAGLIKITCPCPDCNTGVPKEILTNPPYICSNTQCPADKVPAVCSSVECSSHELNQQSGVPQKTTCGPPKPPCAPPKPPCAPPKSPCPPPKSPCPPPKSPCAPPKPPCPSPIASGSPTVSPCPTTKSPCGRIRVPCPAASSSSPTKEPPCARPKSPPPPPCHTPPVPTKKSSSSCPPACLSSCPSWQRARNAKKSFSSKQSQSCSNMSLESSCSGTQFDKMRSICSDSKLQTAGVDPKMLFAAIEGICCTVGELSSQLRNLKCQMQTVYGS